MSGTIASCYDDDADDCNLGYALLRDDMVIGRGQEVVCLRAAPPSVITNNRYSSKMMMLIAARL